MTHRTAALLLSATLFACSGSASNRAPTLNFAPENRVAEFDHRVATELRYRYYGERNEMLTRGEQFFPSTDGAKSCELVGDAIEEAIFGSTRSAWARTGSAITAVTVSVIDGNCQGGTLIGPANVVVTYGFANSRNEGATETTWLVGELGPRGLASGVRYHYSTHSLNPGEWIATYAREDVRVRFEFNGQKTRSLLDERDGDHTKTSIYLGDELVRIDRNVFGTEHGLQELFGANARTWCSVLGEEVDLSRCDGDGAPVLTAEEQEAYAALVAVPTEVAAAAAPATRGSSGPWPELEPLIQPVGGGEQDAAVVVGIEDYAFVADVPGATMNARDWYRYFTQGRNIPTANVKLLLDANATDDAMLAAVRDATARVGAQGTLWFVFIGHGAPAMNQRDGLLVGVDAQQTARGLYGRSVAVDKILAAARGGHASTVLVVDACFSGRTAAGMLAPGLQPILAVADQTPDDGTLIFSAGASDQFAGPLPRANRPAFSYLMLGGLLGWGDADADGLVSSLELLTFIDGTFAALLTDRDQTPQLNPHRNAPLATSAGAPTVDVAAIALQ